MIKDITNLKFNKLLVIKPTRINPSNRGQMWLCKCECGKLTEVHGAKLRNGHTKSCGCIKKPPYRFGKTHPQWAGYGDLSLSIFNRMKANAKMRGMCFNVSIKYLWKLFQKQKGICTLSGRKIALPIFSRRLRGQDNDDLASLDRIDNNKGYVVGNLQWICKRINYMKHTTNEDKFLQYIQDIYNYSCDKKRKTI